MIRHALVAGARTLPFPRGRGSCPTCEGPVLAKCGTINVHHWAHAAADDCDSWSEGIGPWHLSWQQLVRPEFVEVPIGPHRADILGDDDRVIELQHSPISAEVIHSREAYYGNMLWLFDATARFRGIASGPRYFFSLGRARHLKVCAKPVYLDFGGFLLEVEAMSDALPRFSGFGLIREREWFVERFLSERRESDAPSPRFGGASIEPSRPAKLLWRSTERPSIWRTPGRADPRTIQAGRPYIPLDGKTRRPAWREVINRHQSLCNGWSEVDLHEMLEFLNGTPAILDGLVRLLPPRVEQISVRHNVATVRRLLEKLTHHVAAGRLPILEESTRSLLLEKAKMVEFAPSGKLRYLTPQEPVFKR